MISATVINLWILLLLSVLIKVMVQFIAIYAWNIMKWEKMEFIKRENGKKKAFAKSKNRIIERLKWKICPVYFVLIYISHLL